MGLQSGAVFHARGKDFDPVVALSHLGWDMLCNPYRKGDRVHPNAVDSQSVWHLNGFWCNASDIEDNFSMQIAGVEQFLAERRKGLLYLHGNPTVQEIKIEFRYESTLTGDPRECQWDRLRSQLLLQAGQLGIDFEFVVHNRRWSDPVNGI